MASKVYWDSCCFIGLLQDEADKSPALTHLTQQAAANELIIVTSTLAIAEVCKLPDTGTQPEEQTRRVLDFFENPYIVVRTLDRAIAERANRISRDTGIRPLDAVHVATGILAGCDVFYTYDGKKKSKKGLLQYDGAAWLQPMRIAQPPDPAIGTLFKGNS